MMLVPALGWLLIIPTHVDIWMMKAAAYIIAEIALLTNSCMFGWKWVNWSSSKSHKAKTHRQVPIDGQHQNFPYAKQINERPHHRRDEVYDADEQEEMRTSIISGRHQTHADDCDELESARFFFEC